MAEAFAIARSGRPGPVLVDIPKDIQLATGDLEPWLSAVDDEFTLPQETLDLARQMVAAAQKPILYVGGGVGMAQAVPALRAFVAETRMPSVATLKGLGAPDYLDDGYLGMLGMHGTKAANLAVQQSDLPIAVGARLMIG